MKARAGATKTRDVRRSTSAGAPTNGHDAVLQLQRDVGNAAVTAWVQRKTGAPSNTTLRQGAKGPRVREVQELLNQPSLLPAPIAVDGDYGPKTTRAVRAAQKRLGLGVDGKAGPRTMAALRAAATKTAAKAATDEKATARADSAWAIGAQAHGDGKWEQAMAAYAEVITLADEAGNAELQAAASARLKEARLRKPPTPYGDLRAARPSKEDTGEVVAERAMADQQLKDGQYAKALATYLAVYEASNGGDAASEDAWSIASCHHRLGNFDEAVSWYRETASHFTSSDESSFALVVVERTREATLRKPPTPSDELKRKYMDDLEGDSDPAAAKHAEVLRAKAQTAEGKYAAGDVKGALTGLLEVYREALPFEYSLTEVAYNVGVCHHALGHYDQAVEFYRQAREVNRGRAWYVSKLERLGGDSSGMAATAAEARENASSQIAKALRHQKL